MNKNVQISDVVYQLQNIDYSTLWTILRPIIIGFIANRLIKLGKKNYDLRKDYKATGLSIVELPPEIKRAHLEIDKERLLQQQFGDSIINFVTTITEKIPNVDLTLFYNNLATLTTSTKKTKFKNMVLKTGVQGYYTPNINEVVLQEKNCLLTIDHELFHMASTYYRENDDMVFSGFNQHGKIQIAEGINEGYTQLLTERYFGESKPLLQAYKYEKSMAEKLEMIVGQEKMQSLYLNANLQGLVQELNQYEEENVIMQFFADIDFLQKYLDDKHLLPTQKGMIISKLKSANRFLLGCYTKKLKVDFDDEGIEQKEFKEKMTTFLQMLGMALKVGKRRFDFFDVEVISEIISNGLTDLKINVNAEENNKSLSK